MAQSLLFAVTRVQSFIFILFFSASSQSAIFGNNNIHLMTSSSSKHHLGQATAIAILNSNYEKTQAGKVTLFTEPITSLCKSETMHNEPSLAFACTGFLIAPDLLVTAGHCLYAVNSPNQELKNESGLACEIFDWYFDFEANSEGIAQTKDIASENLYRCKRIIYAVQKETAPFQDYALVQLDRAVVNRTPLKLAQKPSAEMNLGTSLFMIGHPFGTPKKMTDQGDVILNNPVASTFVTNLDAFNGNSGSPVFNSKNEVTGILVSGTPSANTYYDSENKCERLNRCSSDGKTCQAPDTETSWFPGFQIVGSDVQRIEPILQLLKDL
ncbi:MAG: trypsin-like serine peptidase [Pseudobdellovibrionaceae bacterium]